MQLIAPETPTAISSPLAASVRGYAAASTASSTRRAYSSDWRAFTAWCEAHRLVPLPVSTSTLCLYLAFLADSGRSLATIRRRLASITKAHRVKQLPSPRDAEEVRLVMRGIARVRGAVQRRVEALVPADLKRILAKLPPGLLAIRDRALLLLGFSTASRRSELAALELSDLRFSERGLQVTVRKSKTDQLGVGTEKFIPFGADAATCPVRCLRAWLEATKLEAGPVFRSVTKHGRVGAGPLEPGSIARIIKRAARAAGMDTKQLSGHSLRAGFVTAATMAEKPAAAIMAVTGHRSMAMLQRYFRAADGFRTSPLVGLGL